MIVGAEENYNNAKESLERMQNFDVSRLPRESDLGKKLNFKDAVEPAQNLIDLYKGLSVTALEDFPDNILRQIHRQANDRYKNFKDILDFTPDQEKPGVEKANFINRVKRAYESEFDSLHPYIAYSLYRSADFQRLDQEARAILQSIRDESEEIMASLKEHKGDAEKALKEIRKVAAEQGVTPQAVHFNAEFEHHNKEADLWKDRVAWLTAVLVLLATTSLFWHKIPLLAPETVYDAVQLTISKVLIFSVMAYLLFLSARNFLNHKHNAIVNKHRQNALLTHRALVEASGDEGVRDAVLLQAASCIFSPQPTGYAPSHETDVSRQKSTVEILSKPVADTIQDSGR